MLTSLSIKNYALIDNLQVNFKNGLTIITGETGAGKSILLGGLSLILGKRVDITNVKDTSKKCVIEATFDIANYNLKTFFKDEDLDYESETIIRREILPSGKSRAFVNDSPVNLNVLSILGAYLIDIHSQHQTLELANHQYQFQIIDALANNDKDLSEYAFKLKRFKDLSASITVLQDHKAEAIKEYDYNVFLLHELEEANLIPDELTVLETEYETLNNIEAIKDELNLSSQLLNDEQIGILQEVTTLKNSLQKLYDISSAYSELYNRVDSVLIELDDVFGELMTAQEHLEANPNRLEEINKKLQKIHHLLLKHASSTIDDLLEIQQNYQKKYLLRRLLTRTLQKNKSN